MWFTHRKSNPLDLVLYTPSSPRLAVGCRSTQYFLFFQVLSHRSQGLEFVFFLLVRLVNVYSWRTLFHLCVFLQKLSSEGFSSNQLSGHNSPGQYSQSCWTTTTIFWFSWKNHMTSSSCFCRKYFVCYIRQVRDGKHPSS